MSKTSPFDEKDRDIARYLSEHPDATIPEIADGVGIPEGTVEHRRSKMVKAGVLQPAATFVRSWSAVGLPWRFRIDIMINQLELRDGTNGGGPGDCPPYLKPATPIDSQERLASFIKDKLVDYVAWRITEGKEIEDRPSIKHSSSLTAEQFKSSIIVQDVTILLGHTADLSAMVRSSSLGAIRKFVTSGLRMMKGISATSTAHEVWSYMDMDL